MKDNFRFRNIIFKAEVIKYCEFEVTFEKMAF